MYVFSSDTTVNFKFLVAYHTTDYGDIFNNGGWGFLLESDIKEKYHTKYQDTRVSYSLAIQNYIDAQTEDERQQAYHTIKSQYENYSEFLVKAYKELGVE